MASVAGIVGVALVSSIAACGPCIAGVAGIAGVSTDAAVADGALLTSSPLLNIASSFEFVAAVAAVVVVASVVGVAGATVWVASWAMQIGFLSLCSSSASVAALLAAATFASKSDTGLLTGEVPVCCGVLRLVAVLQCVAVCRCVLQRGL